MPDDPQRQGVAQRVFADINEQCRWMKQHRGFRETSMEMMRGMGAHQMHAALSAEARRVLEIHRGIYRLSLESKDWINAEYRAGIILELLHAFRCLGLWVDETLGDSEGGETVSAEPLDIDALEQIADAATPGPWGSERSTQGFYEIAPLDDTGQLDWSREVASTASNDVPNAEYIASFDPPTVKTLMAELRRARAQVAEAKNAIGDALVLARKGELDGVLFRLSHYEQEDTDHDD